MAFHKSCDGSCRAGGVVADVVGPWWGTGVTTEENEENGGWDEVTVDGGVDGAADPEEEADAAANWG
jgi:hypothetical protein